MAALAVIPVIGKLLERIIPDKDAQNAAKAQLSQLALTGELQQITGQLDVDKTEAASGSIWVSGWRPGIGWVCFAGLLSQFVVRPFVMWIAVATNHPNLAGYPSLDLSTLMTLVFSMLGIGIHQNLTS